MKRLRLTSCSAGSRSVGCVKVVVPVFEFDVGVGEHDEVQQRHVVDVLGFEYPLHRA
jgi:hypothetical protein